jgi:FKBP-type peptidyl-prolyl cis-trans isomerase
MFKVKINAAIATLAVVSMACTEAKKTDMELNTEVDKFSYALGMDLGSNVANEKIDSLNIEAMILGMENVLRENETKFTITESQSIVREYLIGLQQVKAEREKKEADSFFAENGQKEGMITTASGLQYEVLTPGTGATPTADDVVKVHYTGTLLDGTKFDSSVDRGEPAQFKVGGVIPGWTEALQLMKVGAKYKLYIPSELGYGQRGAGALIKPGATLVFEVELLDVIK